MEEKELFEDYEMRSWEFTPRIYKILGIAALTNLLFLAAFGQFNLLTTRGCDTPYAGLVCQVLDSAYVASTFLGEDTKFRNDAFIETKIEDADITYIDVSDKLEYPEGYFALANPEQTSENLPPNDEFAGLPPSMNSDNPLNPSPSNNNEDLLKPQVTPTPNKSLENQEDVDSPFVFDSGKKPSVKPAKTPRITKTPKLPDGSPDKLPGSGTVAITKTPTPTPTPAPSQKDADIAREDFQKGINKKPLQDFADGIVAKLDSPKPEDKIDLKQAFTVVLDGTLTKEGKFDAKKTRFTKGEGNEQMINVAKSAIEAMGDSSLFSYLVNLGVDKVNITLVQNDKDISAIITSNQPSEERARTISSGFNGLIVLANMNTKDDKEVQALLKATKFESKGKNFVINFSMPKDDAHKMIDQKLQEARQKKSQTNGSENVKESATAKGL
jgi:hypothetical protein